MRDSPNAVMIFAAGFGTRLRPLTDDLPKPMVKLGGQMMIDRARALARDAGAAKIVANLHYKAEKLEAHLAGSDVTTILESPDILDTGGGLKHALDELGHGAVWTMNPDVLWSGPNPLVFAREHWEPERMDALLVCIDRNRAMGTNAKGDFLIDADGRLTPGPGAIYGGVQIIKTSGLDRIRETAFSLHALWDQYRETGRCHGCIYPGDWCDIGTLEGLDAAKSFLKDHTA